MIVKSDLQAFWDFYVSKNYWCGRNQLQQKASGNRQTNDNWLQTDFGMNDKGLLQIYQSHKYKHRIFSLILGDIASI